MSKDSISIALCTYNGERFLQEQLDSLAAQTRLPDEVVVGDDGSTDGTMEILERWAETVPFPVRIQKNENSLKAAGNFYATIERCTGDLIFLCDQDDVWLPEKLEKMTDIFARRPEVGLMYCQADTIDQNGQPLGVSRSKISRAHIMVSGWPLISPFCVRHNNPPGCCAAIRTSCVLLILPFNRNFPHDMFFYLRLPAVSEIVTLPEPLIRYRFHGNNVSFHGDWNAQFKEYLDREAHFYQWITGIYFNWENKIQAFLDWLETVPDSPYKQRYVRYIHGNQRHYPNRHRVQGNFFVFFPLFFVEVFTGRYFQRFQPFRSMAYDVWTGLKNGLDPLATLRLIGSLAGKVWRKIQDR